VQRVRQQGRHTAARLAAHQRHAGFVAGSLYAEHQEPVGLWDRRLRMCRSGPFLPSSCPIVPLWGGESGKNWPRWGAFSFRRLKADRLQGVGFIEPSRHRSIISAAMARTHPSYGASLNLLHACGTRNPTGAAIFLTKGFFMSIQTIGIIGAGTMGNGIAQACAVAGLRAVMVDISETAVQKGLATIAGSLERLVKKEKSAPPTRTPRWRASRLRRSMRRYSRRSS